MTRRRVLRQSGSPPETPSARAQRLAEVQLVAYKADHKTREPGALIAFFVAGYLTALTDCCEVEDPPEGKPCRSGR